MTTSTNTYINNYINTDIHKYTNTYINNYVNTENKHKYTNTYHKQINKYSG